MAKSLRVVHKPPGYEAWKDETTIPRPNLKAIIAIIGVVFICGALTSAIGGTIFWGLNREEPVPPTLVALIENTATPTPQPTWTPGISVVVREQVEVTPTVIPPTKGPSPTVDLEATMDALRSEQLTQVPIVVVSTEVAVYCDGAPFENYSFGADLVVTFQQPSALRLLDMPREPHVEPRVLKQLYDGDEVRIQGEPVCGQWEGRPVVYYPVYAHRLEMRGFVGFGRDDNVWLERIECNACD